MDAGIDLIGYSQGADHLLLRLPVDDLVAPSTFGQRTEKGTAKSGPLAFLSPLCLLRFTCTVIWVIRDVTQGRNGMHRLSYVVALISLVVAGLALTHNQPGTTAQESTMRPPIVGAWFVTTLLDGAPPSPNMTSFYADGTVLTSNRPVYPPSTEGGVPEARSAGHGAWIANADGTVDFTFVVFVSDTNGTYLGQRTLQGRLTLDPAGDVWTAPFTATVTDPTGAVLQSSMGTAEATRIKVIPMEMGATPAAG